MPKCRICGRDLPPSVVLVGSTVCEDCLQAYPTEEVVETYIGDNEFDPKLLLTQVPTNGRNHD